MAVEFSQENFAKLREFIYRKSGISLEGEKHYEKMKKTMESRYRFHGVESFRKYFFILRFEDREGTEFQELMNAVTVNETYFFRENYQFEVLVDHVIPALHKLRSAGEPLRILNAPCSSGEESYSVAIHLLEKGGVIHERDVEIVGIDIDSTMIDKARKGQFSDRSVHAIPPAVKARYFTKKGVLNAIDPDLTEAIRFEVVNVFDKKQIQALGKFDVIFSRNMLIYFDDASRKEVAMTFHDMLKPGGYVFLGHAEYMSRIVSVFHPRKYGTTLVYQK